MKNKFYLLLPVILLLGCSQEKKKSADEERESLKQTDLAFSALSKKEGMKKAFLTDMANSATLLRPDHEPISGRSAAIYLDRLVDTSYTLTWEPWQIFVSNSGELGYTFGIYTLKRKDSTFQGTYVTVWKKEEGQWRWALDTGNPGLGK